MNNFALENKNNKNEIIFALYFFGFVLLKPVVQAFQSVSTLILLAFVAILLCYSILENIKRVSEFSIVPVFFVFFAVTICLLDYFINSDKGTFSFLQQLLIYGAFPIYFLSNTRDLNELIKWLGRIGIIVFLAFSWMPLTSINIFSDYMEYGFLVCVPVFICIHVYRKVYKKNYIILFEIILFVLTFIYANRSSLLIILIFVVVYSILFSKTRDIAIMKVLAILFSMLIFLLFMKEISQFLVQILDSLNIDSYSIRQYIKLLESGDFASFLSGRFPLWQNALLLIEQAPIFGNGITAFESIYGTYSHNIILDILVQFGLFGLIAFGSAFTIALIFACNSKDSLTKKVFVMFLCMWFPKLMLSGMFYMEMGFWLFLFFFCFYSPKNQVKDGIRLC